MTPSDKEHFEDVNGNDIRLTTPERVTEEHVYWDQACTKQLTPEERQRYQKAKLTPLTLEEYQRRIEAEREMQEIEPPYQGSRS